MHYYAAGYYQVAKQQRIEHVQEAKNTVASAPPKPLPQAASDAKAKQPDTEQAENSEPAAAPQEQEGDNGADAR